MSSKILVLLLVWCTRMWRINWSITQCSKYASTCRYTISELLFVPEFHACTYQYTSSSLFVQPPVQFVPGILSPGVKRDQGVTVTTHHLVPRSCMSRSYASSPPAPALVCCGNALPSTYEYTLYPFTFFHYSCGISLFHF
jgi:hypothetical protein